MLLDAGASVECRPQHLLQFAVMGARLRAGRARASSGRASGCCRSARKRRKGNELTREAHRLLKAAPLNFIGNVEAREIYSGDADVDRLRRLHRQRRAEDRAKGSSRRSSALLGDELQRHVLEPGRLRCCRGGRSGGSAGASTTPSTAARRCSASPACAIVGHGRSSAKAVRNAIAMARGSPTSDVVAAASSTEIAVRGGVATVVIAFVFPGQGSQEVGMGQALADAVSRCAATTFAEADAALGEPLERALMLRRARGPS